MSKKRKIANNCEKATFLIEKSLLGPLSQRDNFYMGLHLKGCDVCRIYQVQSMGINYLASQLLSETAAPLKLDDDFKKKLHLKVNEALRKG